MPYAGQYEELSVRIPSEICAIVQRMNVIIVLVLSR